MRGSLRRLLFPPVVVLLLGIICSANGNNKTITPPPPPPPPPHILFVLIDDLGWGDVGFHSKRKEAQTPIMDSLVKEGVELDRHYVHHSCTGTRTSLQSGRYPVHVQTGLKNPEEPDSGMPRNLTGLAEHLKKNNLYATHYVGKWDAGMASPKHTPKGRGYDSSLNYFEHKNDFWTQACMQSYCCRHHLQEETSNNNSSDDHTIIYDLWETDHPAVDLVKTDYEELIFKKRLLDIIDQHHAKSDNSKDLESSGHQQQPLFLFYAPHVAHCPLQVPQSYLDQFDWMDDDDEDMCRAETDTIVGPHDNSPKYSCRKQYHAMVKLLDDILGDLVDRFKHHGMWENTLMVVTSDNGGPIDPDESAATNYPLRGGKYSDFEGGVRAVAFASGGYIPEHRRDKKVVAPIHICDWYATLPALAGIDVHDEESIARLDDKRIPPVDGVDVWPLIVGEANPSKEPRKEIPLSRYALIQGDFKLFWRKDKNVSESGWTTPDYPNSHTGKHGIRNQSINCSTGCLFDVAIDPSERNDVASAEPTRVEAMKRRLVELRKGFFENDDTGRDSCPEGTTIKCACWMAVNYYGGFFGPYQEVDIAAGMHNELDKTNQIQNEEMESFGD